MIITSLLHHNSLYCGSLGLKRAHTRSILVLIDWAFFESLNVGGWLSMAGKKILQMYVNSEQDKCIFLSRLERVLSGQLPPSS